jgi:hypothetical protein
MYGTAGGAFLAVTAGDTDDPSAPLPTTFTLGGSTAFTLVLSFLLPSEPPGMNTGSLELLSMRYYTQSLTGQYSNFDLAISLRGGGGVTVNWYDSSASGNVNFAAPPPNGTMYSYPGLFARPGTVVYGAWNSLAMTVDATGVASLYSARASGAVSTAGAPRLGALLRVHAHTWVDAPATALDPACRSLQDSRSRPPVRWEA